MHTSEKGNGMLRHLGKTDLLHAEANDVTPRALVTVTWKSVHSKPSAVL
jgi:hypothetical protein